MLTYGDGVADVDLDGARRVPRVARPAGHGDRGPPDRPASASSRSTASASAGSTRSRRCEGWINGGYFVLEPGIFDYIPGDVDWAKEPLESTRRGRPAGGVRHEGFWQCMDTLRDKIYLNALWEPGQAPVEGVGVSSDATST